MKVSTKLSIALLLVNGMVHTGSKQFTNRLTQSVNVTLVSIADGATRHRSAQPSETITIQIAPDPKQRKEIGYKSTYASSLVVKDASGKTLASLANCPAGANKCSDVLNSNTYFDIKMSGNSVVITGHN